MSNPKDIIGSSNSHACAGYELFLGDCVQTLAHLPAGSVDIVATDPAYSGMNNMLKLGKGRIVGAYADPKYDKWFPEFIDNEENFKALCVAIRHAMKDGGHLYMMFDNFSLLSLAPILRSYFEVKNIIVWDKVNIGLGHNFRRRHELIVFATKGKRPLTGKGFPDVWSIKRLMGGYPTQKPVALFEKMVAASLVPGGVLCDPFMGSGASGVAALKHGMRFIGCDISKKSFDLVKARLDGYLINDQDTGEK